MKNVVCPIIGAIGGAISAMFGGWDAALTTLVICMAVDYVSDLVGLYVEVI